MEGPPGLPLLAPLGPAPDEAIYADPDAVKAALQAHARENGYAVSVTSSRDQRIIYKCAKGGKYRDNKDPTTHKSRRRKNTSTMKCDCPFTISAKHLDGQSQSGWQVKVADNNHNHGPVAALSALPQHRVAAMTLDERLKVKQMHSENHSANQILTTLRLANPNSMLVPRDIYNLLAGLRIDELSGKTPIEWLLDQLKEKNFSPKDYVNPETNKLECLFFAHPEAIAIYKQHPDILLLDCT
jgi:hypothetical protein